MWQCMAGSCSCCNMAAHLQPLSYAPAVTRASTPPRLGRMRTTPVSCAQTATTAPAPPAPPTTCAGRSQTVRPVAVQRLGSRLLFCMCPAAGACRGFDSLVAGCCHSATTPRPAPLSCRVQGEEPHRHSVRPRRDCALQQGRGVLLDRGGAHTRQQARGVPGMHRRQHLRTAHRCVRALGSTAGASAGWQYASAPATH